MNLQPYRKILTFYSAAAKPNIQAILEFEKKYRQQVSARHEKLPSNFDTLEEYQLIAFTSVLILLRLQNQRMNSQKPCK